MIHPSLRARTWRRLVLSLAIAGTACSRSGADHERPAPPASAPAPTATAAPAAAPVSSDFTIEYRTRTHFPTCRGNERIKVDAQGGVFHQVNDRDCPNRDGWTAAYGAPHTTLTADERAKLADTITTSGVLDLPPLSEDSTRTGGMREELDIAIAGRHVVVAVERTTVPAFTRVRQALIDLAAR